MRQNQPAPSRLAPLGAARPPAAPVVADLPELRDHIRARRAALAGFMEQGASLALDGDLLRVTPRNDIYIRYLNDNRASICELASELYGRKLRVEVSLNSAAGAATGGTEPSPVAAPASGPSSASAGERAIQSAAPSPALAQLCSPAPVPEAAADSPPLPARSITTDRQALYADPVVRRIFDELQGRLVEVRDRPAVPSAPPAAAPATLGGSASNDSAAPPIRRLSQE